MTSIRHRPGVFMSRHAPRRLRSGLLVTEGRYVPEHDRDHHRQGEGHSRPGRQLKVTDVRVERRGLCTVQLTELAEQPLVA
ncbi:hypothetical protein ONA91_20875 [Micromonospora sp. DR5-3]|uniref:hypothetical protein n=1 Tax=unclassified Micromonospora TaxID=2617518 RepID=UPI0011DC5544|nr:MULTISPECIES: hypothetical protein [unclassified Micromonospora]MCW3816904.1 hypothetical protein [Micromonospora sp. DR5-3]TYC23405.1 hypothetical protein FXF52_15525 [Micromonospora sp. MP36]